MTSYQEAYRTLNTAQKQAVDTIDGPVLVIAGPGTGKTQLLTTRIAHILSVTDTLPQNILCLTFTESAAQTMRSRLSDMIGQAAYDVTISTYHAFGSELIRRYPDYFAEQADMQPVDDLGIDRIFRDIIANLPYSDPLKYADTYLGDIKTLVSDAKRALLTPQDLHDIAQHNLDFIAHASPIVSEKLGIIARIDKKCLPLFRQLADAFGQSRAVEQTLAARFAEQLHEAVALAEESGKTNAITAWKNAWLAKNDQGQFIVDGERTNQKLLAAANVYKHYLQALQASKLFDYDDMILRAVHALHNNADFRYTLQEQYQYVLLDEFQDTNGAQLRLVQLLSDNPVHEGRPNVLAVGDDDQAIYAFQGANYSHMLQFKEMYKDVTAIPLSENYRSHADILATARGVAEQIETRLHHHFPEIEKTLIAAGKNLPAKSAIERREAQSDVMQFAWTAGRIAQLIADGIPASDIAVLAPQHKHLVPLVPFLQRSGIAVRYEKRENILDDPHITQLVRMAQLVLALQANNRLGADSLWAEVLSYDFWNLPTSVIWELSWRTNDQNLNWTDELLKDRSLRSIALFFIRLSQLATQETLETTLDYLIGSSALNLAEPGEPDYTSPFFAHHFGDIEASTKDGQTYGPFWELLSNLIVLRSRLRDYRREDENERLHLKDLIDFIDAHRAADIKILNTSPYASGADAVQLLTAYKAKGMEFAAVFVLAVNDEAWGSKARSMGSRLPLPANLQFIRYAGATDDERLRLFYVAITRAKSQLYLVNYAQNYAGKHLTRLRYLNEYNDDAGHSRSPLLPASKQIIIAAEDGAPTPSAELAAYWQQRHESALLNADMRALLEDRLANYQLSPTHLNDFTDVANCGPQAFFLRTILRFPQAPKPPVQYGNAIHETLEWLHITAKKQGTLPNEKAISKAFEQLLRAKRLSEHDTDQFLERGQLALRAYIRARGDSFKADDIVEYNFRSEGVFAGKAHLSGKIDKLMINKSDKTIQIVDNKTAKAHTRWTREVKLHKYRQQLYLYKALVEGSHTFGGYRVTDAYLEFIEPDETGAIQQLHVQFDEQTYKRITQLAESAWQHIKDIDLPDTSGYSSDIAGVETFENDLLSDLL